MRRAKSHKQIAVIALLAFVLFLCFPWMIFLCVCFFGEKVEDKKRERGESNKAKQKTQQTKKFFRHKKCVHTGYPVCTQKKVG